MFSKTNVMVVDGSGKTCGARGHAILHHLDQTRRLGRSGIGKLFAAPGNGGTGRLATTVPVPADDLMGLYWYAKRNDIGLTIVSADEPLARGLVDIFQSRGQWIWGPTRAASKIEWSKAYAAELMDRVGIPRAKSQTCSSLEQALAYVRTCPLPCVIKADGLDAGKGVTICHTVEQAEATLRRVMNRPSGSTVVIEEFLDGYEISLHVFCANGQWQIMPLLQDHKPRDEGNQGPMTGGMGAVRVSWLTPEQLTEIEETIIKPLLAALAADGRPFTGVLFPGLMMTSTGPKVLEVNARFGDPETACLMRLLKTSLLTIAQASRDGTLDTLPIEWRTDAVASVVLSSGGYPGEYEVDFPITGLEQAKRIPKIAIFHAGTRLDNQQLVTAGGRVLNITALGRNLPQALSRANQAAESIQFQGRYFRRDIGVGALYQMSRTLATP